jgi:hypothetical protein
MVMIIGVTDGTIVNITLPTFLSINLTVSYHDNNYTNGDVFTVYHVTRIYSVPRLSVGNDTKPSVEVGSLFTPNTVISSVAVIRTPLLLCSTFSPLMKNIRQNIELELLFTTSSNRHVQVTVTAPLLFPGQILGYTEIRRGQIEKITLEFLCQ